MTNKVEILRQKGYNFLWVNDFLWMWDIPEEVKYQRKIAEQASGNVLVAGYGLGLVQRFLTNNQSVNSITSVELIPEVIDRCREVYGEIYGEVVIGNFYDFQPEKRFDSVIGDIWRDMEEDYLDEYTTFKTRAQELVKPNGKILAWGQDYFEYLLNRVSVGV